MGPEAVLDEPRATPPRTGYAHAAPPHVVAGAMSAWAGARACTNLAGRVRLTVRRPKTCRTPESFQRGLQGAAGYRPMRLAGYWRLRKPLLNDEPNDGSGRFAETRADGGSIRLASIVRPHTQEPHRSLSFLRIPLTAPPSEPSF